MFELPADRITGRVDLLARWVPRVAIAFAFISLGAGKFSEPYWIGIFDRIGFGQWFRYTTGVLQITGGVLVLIPKAFLPGIFILASTMLGAMLAWIYFLNNPLNAIFPGVFLAVLLVVGVVSYER